MVNPRRRPWGRKEYKIDLELEKLNLDLALEEREDHPTSRERWAWERVFGLGNGSTELSSRTARSSSPLKLVEMGRKWVQIGVFCSHII